jgi:TM2 domain-containing membrane protein YozV
MKPRKLILLIDFIINLFLGVLLLAYSNKLAEYLGVPKAESSFYPNILGGVFVGIALALLIEFFNKSDRITSGLGLLGAIVINLCGGIILIIWLLFGDLGLPLRGSVFLWILAFVLIVLSSIELINHYKARK